MPCAALLTAPVRVASTVTPGEYLASQRAPQFKAGETLPPLTRWGWTLNEDAALQFARWGYALDLGEVTPATVDALDSPTSPQSRLVALVRAHPDCFRLSVEMPRGLQDREPDDAAYLHEADGRLVLPRKWSPEAPEKLLTALAHSVGVELQQIEARAPISVILDGGERGLDVPIVVEKAAAESPDVLAAKGAESWSEYVSRRKAYQEHFFAAEAHRAAPGAVYIFYPTGNQYSSDSTQNWDWDYRWMQSVADYPSGSFYYKEYNSGWVSYLKDRLIREVGLSGAWGGKGDMLSQILHQHAYDVSLGYELAYHWVNAGYSVNPNDPKIGDLALYEGFLKSAYVSGMMGGVAGYFAYPNGGFNAPFNPANPPSWLCQMETLGLLHAEFSYLEDMLRKGTLLAGPLRDIYEPSLPAYEFPTSFNEVRVLVRKKNGEKRWLVSAWASDSISRSVVVDFPPLGALTLQATARACLYDIRIIRSKAVVTVLDSGVVDPSPLRFPNANADPG